MSIVSLQLMTREMCHEFYKGFQNVPAIGHLIFNDSLLKLLGCFE